MSSELRRPREKLSVQTRLTVGVLAVGVGAFGLLQSMVIPVLSQVQAHFDISQSDATWVLTAYLLAAAVSTPLVGRIGDSVGKQRMLVITLSLLAVGSLMAAFAPSIGWMLFARVIQGMGGGVVPLAFGIIRDEVPAAKAGTAVGMIASLVSAAFGIGLVLAGPIVDVLGFRWLFLLPMVVTAVAALATVIAVPRSPVRMPGRISVLPAILLAMWLVTFLVACSEGNERGWTSPIIGGLFAGAVLLFVGWAYSETRAAVPVIDLQLMRVRGVWTSNVVIMLFGFSMFAALSFLPQLMQTSTESGYGFGATISEAGRVLLPMSVCSVTMGNIAPHLVRRFGARPVIVGAALSIATAYALIALYHDSLWQITLWMCLQGIGTGLIGPSVAGVVLTSVRAEQTGVASGTNANIRVIGGAIGTAMMASIVTARSGAGGWPLEVGYRDGFLILAGSMVCAAAAALMIPRTTWGANAHDVHPLESGAGVG